MPRDGHCLSRAVTADQALQLSRISCCYGERHSRRRHVNLGEVSETLHLLFDYRIVVTALKPATVLLRNQRANRVSDETAKNKDNG